MSDARLRARSAAPDAALEAHAILVHGLCQPSAYPGAPARVHHLETHISHVFLTGRFAYKIKKPLELGFLDFSSLDKRRHSCEEELRINSRLAPELYLGVVPIAGTPSAPRVEGAGPALEYAVKMLEFSQAGMLEQVLARGELSAAMIDELAAQVARFHAGLPPAPASGRFGTPQSVVAPALQNFAQLAPLLEGPPERARLERLEQWTREQHVALQALLAERLEDGFVRECHGDLHLGNMVLIEGAVRIFDAIEFNPELRWIDVMNEVAFLAMDLLQRGRRDLAFRFVNAYLEHTGDYSGVRLLRYYLVYRALVRAKVAAIRAAQPQTAPELREGLQTKCTRHLALADGIAAGGRAVLIIHHGLSGSGKTTCSQTVLETLGAIRIRSDVERKRLHGLAPAARTGAAIAQGIYQSEATRATYERLAQLARAALAGGFPVMVDAAFLMRSQRDTFRALAQRAGVPFAIAHYTAREAVLRERIERRGVESQDASEASLEVLDHQLRTREPLGADEEPFAIRFDTEQLEQESLRAEAQRLLAAASEPGARAHGTLGGFGR
jgi:aminoglycoside phosphotransferase family enzyme/predicted kinase